MTKYPLKNLRTPRSLPIPERENEICATCRVTGCTFLPDGDQCINRRSIYADSDFYNYDRLWDEREDRYRELERQELILSGWMPDHNHLIHYKI